MKAIVEKVRREQRGSSYFPEVETRTTLCLVDGTRVEVVGEYLRGVQYEVDVKVERVRAKLPDGYHWEGNEIVSNTTAVRWSVGETLMGKGVRIQGGKFAVVYPWIVEAFKAEGLLDG